MKIHLFKTLEKYKTVFEKDEHGREINIYQLKECVATGVNLFYPNVLFQQKHLPDPCILPLLERTMSLPTTSVDEPTGRSFQPITRVYSTPIFFFIYNTDNYFHFLYDSLPYLISYLSLKKTIPTLKLLMHYPNEQKTEFYPFVHEFLDILNIPTEDIVLVNKDTCYDSLYISTSYTHDEDSNLPPRKEIYSFYQDIVKLGQARDSNSIQTPAKIYVSRRTHLHNDFRNIGTNYTTRRKCVNEDTLVAQLVEAGYTEVFTEKLTTIEKINYFANATHVVGAIGGGISNVLFSKPTTKLEAIVSPTFLEVNQRFKYSLNSVDVTYNLNTEHVEPGEFKRYMRIKVPAEKIIGEIEEVYANDTLLIAYTPVNSSMTGWNAQNKYQHKIVAQNTVEKLDNGLNSAWRIKTIKNIN